MLGLMSSLGVLVPALAVALTYHNVVKGVYFLAKVGISPVSFSFFSYIFLKIRHKD